MHSMRWYCMHSLPFATLLLQSKLGADWSTTEVQVEASDADWSTRLAHADVMGADWLPESLASHSVS